MKRTLCCLMSLLLAFGAFACAAGEAEPVAAAETTAEATAETAVPEEAPASEQEQAAGTDAGGDCCAGALRLR